MTDAESRTEMPKQYVGEEDATVFLGFKSPRTLRNMRYKGNGPSFLKRERRVFYRISDLEEWLREKTVVKTRTSDAGIPLSIIEGQR